jgi:nucleoside-diphosphate-sugar epimerase
MNIVITGGAGFLGQRLARRLLQQGSAADASGVPRTIERITLVDVVPATGFDDPRIEVVAGDITDPTLMRAVVTRDVRSVFHLAAVVSGQAEADFDLGMRINLDASRLLLDVCRAVGHRPRVLFTSSVAVFGGDLPAVVQDTTAPSPRSSYGAQKAIAELLLCDYSRKGFVDGRVARLPTISVRPGKPNKAASSFASGIIREPLNGEASVCPVAPSTRLWLLSPRRAIEALIQVHDLAEERLAAGRIVNLPGLSISVEEMVAALERVAGADVIARIGWQRDEAVERIVGSWPAAWDTSRSHALGLRGDASFDDVVRAYRDDELQERRTSGTTNFSERCDG